MHRCAPPCASSRLAGAEYKEWGAVRKVEEMAYKCSKIAHNSPFAHNLAARSHITSLADTAVSGEADPDDAAASEADVELDTARPTPRKAGGQDAQLLLRSAQALSKALEYDDLLNKAVRVFINGTAANRMVLLFPVLTEAAGGIRCLPPPPPPSDRDAVEADMPRVSGRGTEVFARNHPRTSVPLSKIRSWHI